MGFGERKSPASKDPVQRNPGKHKGDAGSMDMREELCTLLSSIDFKHSRIPPEYLNRKSKPEHVCGELEFAAKWAERGMKRLPEADKSHISNISEFDRRLRYIVIKFKETVEYGYLRGAYRAREALVKGFNIRASLPSRDSDTLHDREFSQYMEVCCTYLRDYGTLIDQTISLDVETENLKRAEQQYKSLRDEIETILEATEEGIFSDPELQKDYVAVATAASSSQLTARQREILVESIELGVKRTICELRERVWQQSRIYVSQLKGKVETIRIRLERMPVLDYSEKITAQIEGMFREFVEEDRRIEENQAQFDQIRGQIAAIENLPGEQARRAYEEDSAMRLHKELRERALREKRNQQNNAESHWEGETVSNETGPLVVETAPI